MNIEDEVRDRLHTEIDALVPDAVRPPSLSPVTVRHPGRARARWLLPAASAAAAVVIAIGTVTLIRHHRADVVAPARPIPAGYVSVGPPMSALGQTRAVGLLLTWDAAAPAVAPPIRFNNTRLSEAEMGSTIVDITVSGRTLMLDFGGSPRPGNQDCGYDYSASALASGRAVAVFIQADPGRWPGGLGMDCPADSSHHRLTLTLPTPLGSRSVLDVVSGSTVYGPGQGDAQFTGSAAQPS